MDNGHCILIYKRCITRSVWVSLIGVTRCTSGIMSLIRKDYPCGQGGGGGGGEGKNSMNYEGVGGCPEP